MADKIKDGLEYVVIIKQHLVEVENSLPASSKAKLVSINEAFCGGHSFEKLQTV